MRLFSGLLALAAMIMVGILLWDLFQERVAYPDKKLIIYAGMFGPGEPMQVLYAGPSPATVPPRPFPEGDILPHLALTLAWPDHKAAIERQYHAANDDWLRMPETDSPEVFDALAEEYRKLTPDYVRQLVAALGESDRENRLKLFYAFEKRRVRSRGRQGGHPRLRAPASGV